MAGVSERENRRTVLHCTRTIDWPAIDRKEADMKGRTMDSTGTRRFRPSVNVNIQEVKA